MKALRYDKTGVAMRDAAIILATSQETWAENVLCSPEGYRSLGWHWFNHPDHVVAIQPDLSFELLELEEIEVAPSCHRLRIRPDPRIRDGWVVLA